MQTDGDAVVRLGSLALTFGRVDRITFHPDGVTPESDTDHTVMLGLIACSFASEYLPDLDVGLIAQYVLVHDLVEAYAGDTPTLRLSEGVAESKEAREREALDRIRCEFTASFPWLVDTIDRYEERQDPEARYVKALDKLAPKITHILNSGATFRVQGMDAAEAAERYERQLVELQGYASDFPPLFDLREQLLARLSAG